MTSTLTAVRVELYADKSADGSPLCVEMERVRKLAGARNGYSYRVKAPASRPATDYTARVIARRDGVSVPLEDTHILWQR